MPEQTTMSGLTTDDTSMNVIFLDVDGVLCTPLSVSINRLLRLPVERQCFDPLSMFWLRWLACHTDAAVVLSSTWRDALWLDDPLCRAIIENLYARLKRNGTPIKDVTPLLQSGDKGEEISVWLKRNPCAKYIILDDHDCFALWPEVRSHWISVPDSRGLRCREVRAAVRYFK